MLLVSLLGLAGVFSLEHFFSFSACDLCIKQRILTAVLATLSLICIFSQKFNKKLGYFCEILITLNIIAMLGLAIFQVGVEKKLFDLPETCNHAITSNQDIEKIRSLLMSVESLKPSCDVPQILFGVSLATWTLLGTLILIFIAGRHWFLKFKK